MGPLYMSHLRPSERSNRYVSSSLWPIVFKKQYLRAVLGAIGDLQCRRVSFQVGIPLGRLLRFPACDLVALQLGQYERVTFDLRLLVLDLLLNASDNGLLPNHSMLPIRLRS